MGRVIVWFSCGVASAVAAKLALLRYPNALIVNCNTLRSEHPDNQRFKADIEKWIGKEIITIGSNTFATIDDVFEQTRYMAGISGARCTVELKKVPRFEFQEPDDIHVFGYTAEETKRIRQFGETNPELLTWWVLAEVGLDKALCKRIIQAQGIALPVMYSLGFKNNNCIGCVKATSAGYWNLVRNHFPEVFDKRAQQSRELGVRLARYRFPGEKLKRVFLDELPPDATGPQENISCGPECTI